MNKFEQDFNRNMAEERKVLIDVNPMMTLLREKGGEWLGSARTWMQRKAMNGDTVTWGSEDYLKLKPLTVVEIESFAATIAAAALREQAKDIQQYGVKGFERIEPDDYYALLDAKEKLKRTERRLALYQQTFNEIDDYFEYRHESRKDRAFVLRCMAKLTDNLRDTEHQK